MPQSHTDLLTNLRGNRESWASVAYNPKNKEDAGTDVNMKNRHKALIALHESRHSSAIEDVDEQILAFLTEQEILFHQSFIGYSSSLSLCCYLSALYRRPSMVWTLWPAKFSGSYDATVCVDSHYMHYAAGGLDALEAYVQSSQKEDVLEEAIEHGGRAAWWEKQVKNYGGNDSQAFLDLKKEVLDRIGRDRQNLTDKDIVEFMEGERKETMYWKDQL